MKKISVIILIVLIAACLVYFVPIMVAKSEAQPLMGNFDIKLKCSGGHEIFLLLEQDRCYMNCPGHDDKENFGPIIREKNAVVIYEADGVTPWARIEHRRSEHFISYSDGSIPEPLEQVVSPWRLRLPYYMSSDH